MKLPMVAIVGRPNVGKSSLFNAIVGRRVSIVDEAPGVTRDRISATLEHRDVTLELVDTGGVGVVDRGDLSDHVERQILFAVGDANAIIFLTDARDGVTPMDKDVARRLRERSREIPVFLVVNKVDHPGLEAAVHEFHSLGMGEPVGVSATHRYGIRDLMDQVVERLWPTGRVSLAPVMKLAVVGRQNVGKSTLVNAIARQERMIVSEVPGTTRDSVDVHFEKDGKRFVVIDTAGVKQISKARNSVEVYSQLRTEDSIRRADVVFLMLAANEDVTRAEKRLADFIAGEARACLIVANKWDLTEGKMTTEAYGEYLYDRLRNLRYAPVISITARDSRNVQSAIDLAQSIFKKSLMRVGTAEVNKVLEAVKEYRGPRVRGRRTPKIYYGAQVGTAPPTFAIFVNDPAHFPADYRRYVEKAFREVLGFDEIPLKLYFRGKGKSDVP